MKSETSSFEEVTEATINNETIIPLTDSNKRNNDLQQPGQDIPNSTKKSPKKVITRNRSRRKFKNNNSKSYVSGK